MFNCVELKTGREKESNFFYTNQQRIFYDSLTMGCFIFFDRYTISFCPWIEVDPCTNKHTNFPIAAVQRRRIGTKLKQIFPTTTSGKRIQDTYRATTRHYNLHELLLFRNRLINDATRWGWFRCTS